MKFRAIAFCIAVTAMLVPMISIPAESSIYYQTTIPLRDGDFPYAVPGRMAYDPANERLFIADPGSWCIHIYERYPTWERVDAIYLNGEPLELDYGTSNQLLYFIVAETDGNHAYSVDPATPWQMDELYPDGEPTFVRVVHSANKVLIYSLDSMNYSRFSPTSQYPEISWGNVPDANDIDIDESNLDVYAVNSDTGFIQRTEILTLNSGISNNNEQMDMIAVDPLNEWLYVVNNSNGYIKQYPYNDWFSGTEFYTSNYVDDIGVQESSGLVYYIDSYENTLYELDPDSGNYDYETTSYEPLHLLIDNTANLAFVSCVGDYAVDIFQLEGSVGSIPEIRSIGTGLYTVDPDGDISTAYVEVVDDIEVVSVTVNGEPLTSYDGENWSGEFTVPPGPVGFDNFEIVATDGDGNEVTGSIGFNRAYPIIHQNKNLWESTIGNYWYQRQAMVYGRVTKVNSVNQVEIRDGSHPGVIKVSANNHGLAVGQLIIARGQLYGHATAPNIATRAAKITVIP